MTPWSSRTVKVDNLPYGDGTPFCGWSGQSAKLTYYVFDTPYLQ
jgi:hypothetical protein